MNALAAIDTAKADSVAPPTPSAFPAWIYDGSPIAHPMGYGEHAVTFLKRLRHTNSDAPNGAFQLAPWQERIVRRI